MKELTEKQEIERKMLLNQQAIPQVSEPTKAYCREQIVILRRRLWELTDGRADQDIAA